MKTLSAFQSGCLGLVLILVIAPLARGEGPLAPPGAPAPTMKSLQEIWDKIGELQAQMDAIQGKVSIEMVVVANAENAADTTGDPNPAGAVAYEFKIGKHQVTNAQYVLFLNAVAATDTHGLFNSLMGSQVRGGITQSGVSGSFTYAARLNMGNKPVNYINFYDALRFCNWMHNGQPTGLQDSTTTEDGAYILTGTSIVAVGSDPTHGANGRNVGAIFHLPSEDEWYKAAHHEPGASGNDYWLYPTRSDSAPTLATADLFGNIDNDTANIANYGNGADWNGLDGHLTTVGSSGTGSQSFYGAADMGGNVFEWNEQIIGGSRGSRGGSFNTSNSYLESLDRFSLSPGGGFPDSGFRVASPQ